MGYSDENFCSNAPWNDGGKKVLVRVTQTLVNDFEVEVGAHATEDEIKDAALLACVTPSRAVVIVTGEDDWYLEKETVQVL